MRTEAAVVQRDQDLLVAELRTRYRAAAWIADHRGEITDDQDGFVTEILKIPQLLQDHTVTEMDIRCCRIHT